MRFTLFLYLLCINHYIYSDIYKCITKNGDVSFSNLPCLNAVSTQSYTPPPVTTRFKDIEITPSKPVASRSTKKIKTHKKSCPFITSTQIRNSRIKQEYIKGLPKSEIEKRFGKPDQASSKSNNTLEWRYNKNDYRQTFTFRNNCLIKWKEAWTGKKSRIDKYREF